jgi:predicted enzyme related to lactoylglutathione lyase
MLEREGFPAGVPCWVDTTQPDPEAAAGFYGDLFGWEFEDLMAPGSGGHYLLARLRGRAVAAVGSATVGSADQDPAPPVRRPPAWNTYICVDRADDAAAKVREAGGRVLVDPQDVGPAGRMAVCSDPSGAVFRVWQAGTRTGAQLVNEPGTWNWSDLHTRDGEGSKSFYRTVFGWEADPVSFGEVEATMWRRPGYAEFLMQFDPDLRRRHSEAGVPDGFSDAVGWMMPLTPDQSPDVASHWRVTFAVADTDAVAGSASALGGSVVAPPFDAGPTRVAVLADPQGAVFTVSTYDPG